MTQIDWKQLEADRGAGTPGPWKKYERDGSGHLRFVAGPYPRAVALAQVKPIPTKYATSENIEANARRIARAPDLEAYALSARRKLEAADSLAENVQDVDRSYETEYDGRTYEICTGCSAQLSDGQPHRPGCAWQQIDAALAANRKATENDQ